MQVGEKEREHDLAALRKDIATQVSEKCVDPTTKRPYPVGIIEKAMNEVGFSVKLNKNAKSQVVLIISYCLCYLQRGFLLRLLNAYILSKRSLNFPSKGQECVYG